MSSRALGSWKRNLHWVPNSPDPETLFQTARNKNLGRAPVPSNPEPIVTYLKMEKNKISKHYSGFKSEQKLYVESVSQFLGTQLELAVLNCRPNIPSTKYFSQKCHLTINVGFQLFVNKSRHGHDRHIEQ
jgi:hypothetical protein